MTRSRDRCSPGENNSPNRKTQNNKNAAPAAGGTNTLRGYRELQFLGSRIAWTNLEYRQLLARRSYCFGFFDSGYYFLPENADLAIASSQHVKYGFGLGIRLETGIGNVGVSFALGQGDALSQGKIHFGLINEF